MEEESNREKPARLGPGYSGSFEVQYGEHFKLGNTDVYIVSPEVTEKDRKAWMQRMEQTLEGVAGCECRVRYTGVGRDA